MRPPLARDVLNAVFTAGEGGERFGELLISAAHLIYCKAALYLIQKYKIEFCAFVLSKSSPFC
jgi:hypothetical protein